MLDYCINFDVINKISNMFSTKAFLNYSWLTFYIFSLKNKDMKINIVYFPRKQLTQLIQPWIDTLQFCLKYVNVNKYDKKFVELSLKHKSTFNCIFLLRNDEKKDNNKLKSITYYDIS